MTGLIEHEDFLLDRGFEFIAKLIKEQNDIITRQESLTEERNEVEILRLAAKKYAVFDYVATILPYTRGMLMDKFNYWQKQQDAEEERQTKMRVETNIG